MTNLFKWIRKQPEQPVQPIAPTPDGEPYKLKRACMHCSFFQPTGLGISGECRYNPPDEDESMKWPRVDGGDWCGSYEEDKP